MNSNAAIEFCASKCKIFKFKMPVENTDYHFKCLLIWIYTVLRVNYVFEAEVLEELHTVLIVDCTIK